MLQRQNIGTKIE